MPKEERRVLTEAEKLALLERHTTCYICNATLVGYERAELEFDHIYSYADDFPQDLSNFAPVHASTQPDRLNCHAAKGRKSPVEYREELRIKKALRQVSGWADIRGSAAQSTYEIGPGGKELIFNGARLPLYTQRVAGKEFPYFFHEVEIRFIENDDEIQLRPLEPKILPLIFNLKSSLQLLPCLCRLDAKTGTVKLFDGQHKAIAQVIGNNRDRIPSLIFLNPDVAALRITVYQAHTDFVQQRYKKSHIDAKLADIYAQRIEAFRRRMGNPEAPYSEADILVGESTALVRKFLLSSILKETNAETGFVAKYAAESRADQKDHPILWQSIERLISHFCNLSPVEDLSESEQNYRSDEIDNLVFVLQQIEESAINGMWNPENTASEPHKVARTYFYRTAFNNWMTTLEEALRFVFEQMRGAKFYGPLCYQPAFSAETRKRFSGIIERLFSHPLWVQPSIQEEIAKTNQDSVVTRVFEREGLDYIYLTRL